MDLWITADDYGLSPAVNAAIEALAEAGAISAVSVMAHRGATLGSIDRLKRVGVAMGLHLCFTREEPLVRALSPGPRARGRLPSSYGRLFAAIALRPGLVQTLAEEGRAQADRLQQAGVAIDFVNSHEHVHLFPPLWPIAASIARQVGAHAVRASLGQKIDRTKDGLLAAASRVSWALEPLPMHGVMSPLGAGRAGALTIPDVEHLLARPFKAGPKRALELCVHPDFDEPGGRREHEMLASGELAALLDRRGVRVVRGGRY